ncbi:alpha/beta fold hydrolase [Microbacterium sp. BK668]|uniref:alpha/beta hydrolase n=1 Tax=Microbacterium sp. BK668 TaxID=2512118 RepID=UPI0010EABFCC|nr:alpha/beta fold hydrolase [Microbacterium sp. BK668]TDN91604.1 prolyl oligopeptidase family protein [Microbacterium sp. BK668]
MDRRSREGAAATRTARHPGQSSTTALLSVCGLTILAWVLVSFGIGLGLPRLDRGGLALVLGGVALLGVSAFVAACIIAIRVFRSWGGAMAGVCAGALLVGVYALSIAFAAVLPPHPPAGAVPSGGQAVTIETADGVMLSGWYLPSRNGAALVLRHGAGGVAADLAGHARMLNHAGYGVLATDARGHGGSGGRGMELGWYGDLDTRAGVDFLVRRADVDPGRIGAAGFSMGGEEAIGASGADDRIRAVVAEGATGRTAADKAWLSEEYGFRGAVQAQLDGMTYALVDGLTDAAPPSTLADSIRASGTTPYLLIAAGEVPDEQSVAARLAAAGAGRVEVWVISGAGHTGGLREDPDAWRERVVAFLDRSLSPAAGSP